MEVVRLVLTLAVGNLAVEVKVVIFRVVVEHLLLLVEEHLVLLVVEQLVKMGSLVVREQMGRLVMEEP